MFSFDDGREDNYRVAYPILNKYRIRATFHVVTGLIDGSLNNGDKMFKSSSGKGMTIYQLKEMLRAGNEISSHGDLHTNSIENINASLKKIQKWKLGKKGEIGFSSPNSDINVFNYGLYKNILNNGEIAYLRTGMNVRKYGIRITLLSLIEKYYHNNYFFYLINKLNIITKLGGFLLPSVSIKCETTINQIEYLLKKMPDNTAIILLFHSILNKNDRGYGCDAWYYDSGRFDSLCNNLATDRNIKLLTISEFLQRK